jgi:hypothetical protein
MNLDDLVAAVDGLVIAVGDDHDAASLLSHCRRDLAALAWERFRVRHEALSRQATAARVRAAFVQRHQQYR